MRVSVSESSTTERVVALLVEHEHHVSRVRRAPSSVSLTSVMYFQIGATGTPLYFLPEVVRVLHVPAGHRLAVVPARRGVHDHFDFAVANVERLGEKRLHLAGLRVVEEQVS